MKMTNYDKDYLVVLLQQQRLLLPIDVVNMVISYAALQTVPDKELAFSGVLNFHGKGIGVYDLENLINTRMTTDITIDTPIILANVDGKEIGLIVQGVEDMQYLKAEQLQTPGDDMMPYVVGIYEDDNKTAWVLCLESLLNYPQNSQKKRGSNV